VSLFSQYTCDLEFSIASSAYTQLQSMLTLLLITTANIGCCSCLIGHLQLYKLFFLVADALSAYKFKLQRYYSHTRVWLVLLGSTRWQSASAPEETNIYKTKDENSASKNTRMKQTLARFQSSSLATKKKTSVLASTLQGKLVSMKTVN
jgi:hypothetical protein